MNVNLDISILLGLLGGLALFLYGMQMMSAGLEAAAGNRMKGILERLTSNRFLGILVGAGITAVIQSSSATTVMVVGFVNSGMMTLKQAVWIIMGANIGTTITGQLIALDVGAVAPLFAFVGVAMVVFLKKPQIHHYGNILAGLGVLFIGMEMMGSAMEPLREWPAFVNLVSTFSNPVVGILAGAAFTALIQSSSASIGILQALSVTGAISYEVAVPMVLGMCIGACVPVLLSAIGANPNGKRTAVIYLYFNIVGSALFMIPFYLLHAFVPMDFMAQAANPFGIAVFNTVFKVAATLVQLPFTGVLVRLAVLTVREDSSEEDEEFQENLLDERFLNYPPLALEQCGRTVERMAAASFKNLNRSMDLFSAFNPEKYEKIMGRENVVDRYEDRIGTYLFHLNSRGLDEQQTVISSHYLHCLTDLERISDHAVHIAELAREINDKELDFSASGVADLNRAVNAVREIVALAQQALVQEDMALAGRVEPLEEVISTMLEGMKLRHIRRLQNGTCTLEVGFVFNDLITDFERVAAHCSNVALAVLELRDGDLQFHDYTRGVRQGDQPEFRRWLACYRDKYLTTPAGE